MCAHHGYIQRGCQRPGDQTRHVKKSSTRLSSFLMYFLLRFLAHVFSEVLVSFVNTCLFTWHAQVFAFVSVIIVLNFTNARNRIRSVLSDDVSRILLSGQYRVLISLKVLIVTRIKRGSSRKHERTAREHRTRKPHCINLIKFSGMERSDHLVYFSKAFIVIVSYFLDIESFTAFDSSCRSQ